MYELNIDCTQFRPGKCLHQAAPRRLFGTALCILEEHCTDIRVEMRCSLQIKHDIRTPPRIDIEMPKPAGTK